MAENIASRKNITKSTSTVDSKPRPSLEYLRDKDKEMVKGIFEFKERPGGVLRFRMKKYKKDDVELYEFKDGETYNIPLGVAKHLNKNGWYPEHAHAVDERGKSIYKVGRKIRRFGFQSLEFIDPEDFSTVDSDLITIENI